MEKILTLLKGNIGKFFAWILVLIVIVSLAGFGIQDVILGSTNRNIAMIGKEKITVSEFIRNLENEIFEFSQTNNQNISIEEAKTYGLVNKALNNLIAKKIFDNFLNENAVSRSNESVAEYIKTVEAFKSISGEFDIEKYKQYVASSGIKMKDFENTVKNDLTRELILGVFAAPSNLDSSIFEKSISHYFQSRNVALIELNPDNSNFRSESPKRQEILAFFKKNKDKYRSPNIKILKVGRIYFTQFIEKQKVDDESIKKYYAENIESFKSEEKRLFDVLYFPIDETENGKKRINEIKANTDLFDDEISSRGLKIEDITLGLVEKSRMKDNDNYSELFKEKKVGIYGPLETDLGLAIYRIREIIPEREVDFYEAKTDIKYILASENAENEMLKTLEKLNNEIAAGQVLEDLAQNFPLLIETIEIENDQVPSRFAKDPDLEKLFKNVREEITEFTLLADNSLIAVKLVKEIKSENLSLAEASEKIENKLTKANTVSAARSYFKQKLTPTDSNFLDLLFNMNKKEALFIEVKKKKIYRFNF